MEMERLLRPGEAAEFLQVNRSTIWRFQKDGLLTFIRIGNSVRFRRSDLEDFVAAGERKDAAHTVVSGRTGRPRKQAK